LALDHAQIIILGERFAYHGIDSLLDYLFRSPESRLSTRVMMIEGATPYEVLASIPLLRSTQAESLRELESTRAGLMVTLKDLFVARSQPHIAPMISLIRTRPHVGTEDATVTREVELAGAAVFHKDQAAVLLHGQELLAAIWFRTDVRNTAVTVPCPNQEEGHFSVRVLRGSHRIVPVYDGRQLSFRVDLSGQVSIIDLQCPVALTSPAMLQALAVPIQQNLVRSVAQTLKRLQAAQVDPFGFGEQVRIHLPGLWRQVGAERWPETWSDVPVKVNANLTVTHQNMSIEPPAVPRNPAKD
jgi:spore germination protein KC